MRVIESAQEWSVVKNVHILTVGVLLIAGCQDSRVPALEQRVKQLEERTRQLEAERTKASEDDAARRAKLECERYVKYMIQESRGGISKASHLAA